MSEKMTTRNLPFFPLYPQDFLGATGKLNAERFGVYTRLLFTSWIEALEDDRVELLSAARCDEKTLDYVLNKFFTLKDGIWENSRLEKERVKALEKHKVMSERGKAGASARWNTASNSPSNAQVMPESMATHNSQPITNKKQPTERKKRFTPPSLDDCSRFFNEKEYVNAQTEGEKFYYFYESKNWYVGKNKMTDWHKAAGSWNARNKENQPKQETIEERMERLGIDIE